MKRAAAPTTDKIEGHLEVGINDSNEVVINLDKDRTGHIVFSPRQAITLAEILLRKSLEADPSQVCWACGRPLSHNDQNLCHGCKHYVCVLCAEHHGHFIGGRHQKDPSACPRTEAASPPQTSSPPKSPATKSRFR